MNDVIFGIACISLGCILVLGAHRRWRWLVDPPKDLWFVYTQSLLKALFGSEVVLVFSYFLGFAFVAAGFYIIMA